MCLAVERADNWGHAGKWPLLSRGALTPTYIHYRWNYGYYMDILLNLSTCQTIKLPYSGKFSNGANFRIFRMHLPHAKIWTCENLHYTWSTHTREQSYEILAYENKKISASGWLYENLHQRKFPTIRYVLLWVVDMEWVAYGWPKLARGHSMMSSAS